MAEPMLQPMMGRVFGLVLDGQMSSQTDGQLLDQFLLHQNHAAFEALVRRHGPMVLATCRRTVLNRQDAEDAFQATFLVLVRKADSIRPRTMVGGWLYGVARKAALKARTLAARRGSREKQLGLFPDVAQSESDQSHDLLPLLEQALLGLPDKFRTPLVLCDLEGKTRREAAQQLGWPEGTVAGRLAQARAMLARKLARHSPALSATALSVLLSQQSTAEILPSQFVASLLALVKQGNAIQTVGIAGNVTMIAHGVLSSMMLGKVKIMALPLLAIVLLTLSGAMLAGGQNLVEPARPSITNQDEPRLEGTWIKARMAIDGRSNALFANNEPYYQFDGNQFAVTNYQSTVLRSGMFKVDTEKQTLFLTYTDRTGKASSESLRYAFKADDLYLASNYQGKESPSEMKTIAGSGSTIFLFRRTDPQPKEQKSWYARMGTLNWRHGEEVRCAALSNDGKLLATGGSTRLNLFSAGDGRLVHALKGHARPINSLTFSPDGKTLLSSSLDGTFREWDTATGRMRRTLIQGVRGIHHAAYSPDGTQIAVGVDAYPDQYLALLNAETGKEIARFPIDTSRVVFSPDGRYLATTAAFNHKSFLIELATRRTVCELTSKMPFVNSIAFTPDSKSLVADPGFSEGFKTRTVVLWDVASGTKVRDLAVVGTPRSAVPLVFTPDGKTLYLGNDSIEMDNGRVLSASNSGFVQPMAVTPDGRLLASQYHQSGVISVVDRKTNEVRTPGMGHRASVFAVLPIKDSNAVVTFGNDMMRAVWKPTARGNTESTPTIASAYLPHAVAVDAQVVAVYSPDTGAVLYDAARGLELKRIKSAQVAHLGIMSISRDGKLVAMTTFHRTPPNNEAIWSIQIVDAGNDKIVSTVTPNLGKPTVVEFSPDSRSMVIGSADGRMQLVDVATGLVVGKGIFAQEAKPPSADAVVYLHFSPDGTALVSGTRNGLSIIWDVATGKEIRRLPKQTGPFQYSPDGNLLASTEAVYAIHLQEAKTGKYLYLFGQHAGAIRCLAFSQDGSRLYSGSDDTNALTWEIKGSKESK